MKKKYFIVSDVHGFYDELIRGLETAGFSVSNPNHIFVSLGDLFDRGDKSYECLQFVNSLPEERKILICGNHEWCLQEAIIRRRFKSHDVHNKTDKTCWEFYNHLHPEATIDTTSEHEVLDWLRDWEDLKTYGNSLKPYAIIKDNLFLHGWVPYWCRSLTDLKHTDWVDWYDSVWTDGVLYSMKWGGKIKTSNRKDAKLVTVFCGHVHSCFHNYKYHNEGEICKLPGGELDIEKLDCSPFIDEGIVNLDSYTSASKLVNVFVLS